MPVLGKDDPFWNGAVAAQDLASEHLADTTVEYTYEITLNIKQEKLTLLEHITAYKNVWAHLISCYKPLGNLYFIEYCKSGQAHLHGYLTIAYPSNSLFISDEHFLRDLSRQVFLLLPKKYWRQHVGSRYLSNYRKLVSPALCLNMKNYLSTNWLNYIEKNAQKNCV